MKIRTILAALVVTGSLALGQSKPGPSSAGVSPQQDEIAIEVIKAVPAEYPPEALQKGIQGAVSVSVVVDPEGKVMTAQASDADPLLQAAAIAAVKQYRFKERTDNQIEQTKFWAELSFDFKLPNNGQTHPVTATLVHGEQFPKFLRVSEGIIKTMILRRVSPVYPHKTMESNAHGSVILDLDISADGKVQDARVHSGSPELAGPMVDAVRQWEFRPYLFLGEPVAVQTQLSWDMKLSVTPTVLGTVEDAKALSAIANHPGVVQGALIHQVQPVYPEIAKEKGVRGQVLVAIIIARDGTVCEARVIRGDPLLNEAAKDAVKQWRYLPYTLNGQPIEVDSVVTVNFE